jgi:hypothetical protein
MLLTQDEKLDEALKETFPASDAFSLDPEPQPEKACKEPADPSS